MAPLPCLLLEICSLIALFSAGCASRPITSATGATAADKAGQPQLLRYHKGALLRGNITVNLIWYGKFTPLQRAVVADFITSLSISAAKPSVADWWGTLEKHYHLAGKPNSLSLKLGRQILDESYSLGKSLSENHIVQLASKGGRTHTHAVNIVLTAANVTVEGFCVNRCGTHGFRMKWVYIWVGNSDPLCPGYCAWPFHRPVYGPQTTPLVAPNDDVGLDGVVMSLSGLLAGTATNPYGNGYFQGPAEAPLEAATACTGVYGKGAYPGYPGKLLVDQNTGASYNAHGVNGRKYLLPAIYDPATSTCSTLV